MSRRAHWSMSRWAGVRVTALALGAVLLLGSWSSAAQAGEEIRVRPGARVWAELDPGEELPLGIEAVGGSQLTVSCKAWKKTTLLPVLRVTGPDGRDLNLAPYLKSNRKGNLIRIKKLPLTENGTYYVRVSGDLSTTGGFDLTTSAKVPLKRKGELEIAAGEPGVIVFGALDGDLVTCVVKPGKKSPVRPLLTELRAADGAVVTIEPNKKVKKLGVTGSGAHELVVIDSSAVGGTARYTLSLKPQRAIKQWRDVRELMATGSIKGRLLIGPSAREDSSAPARKKAGRKRGKRAIRAGELVVSVPSARSDGDVLEALGDALPNVRFELVAQMTETGPYLVRVVGLTGRRGKRRNRARTGALAKAATASSTLDWVETNQIVRVTK